MLITIEKVSNKETAFIWLTKDESNIDLTDAIAKVKTKFKDYCIFKSGSKDIKETIKELIMSYV